MKILAELERQNRKTKITKYFVWILIAIGFSFLWHQLSKATELTTNWKIVKIDGMTEYSINGFSLFCREKTCIAGIEPDKGCTPGASFPLLVNSSKRVGVIPAKCVLLTDYEIPREIIVLQKSNTLIYSLFNLRDISIALPETKGGIQVFYIPSAGVNTMLKKELKKTPIKKQTQSSERLT